MALKTIETRAVISAQDKTGATFAEVAQKLKRMESAANEAGRRVGAAARYPAQQAQASMAAALRSGAVVNANGCADSQLTAMLEASFPPYDLAWSSGGVLLPVLQIVLSDLANRQFW